MAKTIGTDRRVIDTTAQRIIAERELRDIFLNMRATPDLSQVAGALGLTVITILPRNAFEKGIVGAAVQILHRFNLGIRQIFVTDPYFSEQPRLVIIIGEPLPPGVIEELRVLPQIRQIIL